LRDFGNEARRGGIVVLRWLKPPTRPSLATFGSDDPKHQSHLEGLAKMKQGYGQMMHGSLLIAEDARVPEEDRRAMLGYVTAVLPKLLPFAEPAMQQTIRDNLAKQAEAKGPLHEAFVVAQRALPQ